MGSLPQLFETKGLTASSCPCIPSCCRAVEGRGVPSMQTPGRPEPTAQAPNCNRTPKEAVLGSDPNRNRPREA